MGCLWQNGTVDAMELETLQARKSPQQVLVGFLKTRSYFEEPARRVFTVAAFFASRNFFLRHAFLRRAFGDLLLSPRPMCLSPRERSDCMTRDYLNLAPVALIKASRPILSMVLMAAVLTRSRTKRFLDSDQKRLLWRLGRNSCFVLRLECDTR